MKEKKRRKEEGGGEEVSWIIQPEVSTFRPFQEL